MTLSFPRLTTYDSWRLGIGAYYSPAIKDDSVMEYDAYFDGEVGIDLFIGPFTIGVRLTWEHK